MAPTTQPKAVCQRFREHAPVHPSAVERRYLETLWLELVVMQHYGAPARLADGTKSPWVAAFFAVSGSWEADGNIYGFRRDLFEDEVDAKFRAEVSPFVRGPHRSDMELDQKWDLALANDALFQPKTVSTLSEWVATYYSREGNFLRLTAQQGFFTFASRPNVDHWAKITDLDSHWFVVLIAHSAKLNILPRLNGIGLTGRRYFRDLMELEEVWRGLLGVGRRLATVAILRSCLDPTGQLRSTMGCVNK
jgi:hypothetical protein